MFEDLLSNCPCCGSKELTFRDQGHEDMVLVECLDCECPDFYLNESGEILQLPKTQKNIHNVHNFSIKKV